MPLILHRFPPEFPDARHHQQHESPGHETGKAIQQGRRQRSEHRSQTAAGFQRSGRVFNEMMEPRNAVRKMPPRTRNIAAVPRMDRLFIRNGAPHRMARPAFYDRKLRRWVR